MNTEKKIDQFLRAAPKPPVPDGLLDKLQADVSAGDIKTQRSVLRGWFAPSGDSISPWRVTVAAAIAILVLLPLTYAGGKIIKTYIFTEGPKVEVIENEDGSMAKIGSISVETNTPGEPEQPNAEEAKEIEELRKAGKYDKEFVQEWVKDGFTFRLYRVSYTLSSGKVITVNEVVGSHD